MSRRFLKLLCYRLLVKQTIFTPLNKKTIKNDIALKNNKMFFIYFIDFIFSKSLTEFSEQHNTTFLEHLTPFATKTKQNNTFVNYAKYKLKREMYSWFLTPVEDNAGIQFTLQTKKKNVSTLNTLTYWTNVYSFYPVQSLLSLKLSVINYNILNLAAKQDHTLLIREALHIFPFLQLNRVAAHFIATIYSALILKDSKALTTFIRNLLRDMHFKEHPFYFNFVGYLVRTVIQPQLHHFACLGVSVVFRGKLGIGGNARKRALKYQTGMVSSSSKYVKLTRSQDVVRTKTGIVGFTVIVAW